MIVIHVLFIIGLRLDLQNKEDGYRGLVSENSTYVKVSPKIRAIGGMCCLHNPYLSALFLATERCHIYFCISQTSNFVRQIDKTYFLNYTFMANETQYNL